MNVAAVMTSPELSLLTQGVQSTKQSGETVGFEGVLGQLLSEATAQTATAESGAQASIPVDLEAVVKLLLDFLSGELSEEDAQATAKLLAGDNEELSENLMNVLELVSKTEKVEIAENSENVDNTENVSVKIDFSDNTDEEITAQAAELVYQMLTFVQSIEKGEDTQQSAEKLISKLAEIVSDSESPKVREIADAVVKTVAKMSEDGGEKLVSRFNQTMTEAKPTEDMPRHDFKIVTEAYAPKESEFFRQVEAAKSNAAPLKMVQKSDELSELTAVVVNKTTPAQTEFNLPTAIVNEDAAPVENQIMTALTEQLVKSAPEDSTTKLTMTLVPEKLGKISIEIVKKGTEVTISIVAKEALTQKLIEEKLPLLASNLKAGDSEIKAITVVAVREDAAEMFSQYSSQNFGQSASHSNSKAFASEMVFEEIQPTDEKSADSYEREGLLWQTA